MIPAWAPIAFDFDQEKIKQELLANNVFSKSMVATTDYTSDKNSIWDPTGTLFSEEIFRRQKLIPHYVDDPATGARILNPGTYNTFTMLNLTHLPEFEISKQEAWEGSLKDKTRTPLWLKYSNPWSWREDLNISYTRKIINSLPIEYPLTVRCILQTPPSIGVVHKDSGPKSTNEFYRNGFGSLTLNIADGGGNLWFLNQKDNKKYMIQESLHKCWHFNDSNLHCTTEVKDIRIQIRIFAKLSKDYLEIMTLKDAIY